MKKYLSIDDLEILNCGELSSLTFQEEKFIAGGVSLAMAVSIGFIMLLCTGGIMLYCYSERIGPFKNRPMTFNELANAHFNKPVNKPI